MRKHIGFAVAIAAILFARSLPGAGISVNFSDGRNDGVFPVEGVAGFVPLGNWNNIEMEGRDGFDPPTLIDYGTGHDRIAHMDSEYLEDTNRRERSVKTTRCFVPTSMRRRIRLSS